MNLLNRFMFELLENVRRDLLGQFGFKVQFVYNRQFPYPLIVLE